MLPFSLLKQQTKINHSYLSQAETYSLDLGYNEFQKALQFYYEATKPKKMKAPEQD